MAGAIKKRSGSWLVTLEMGRGPKGQRLRKYVTVKSKKEAENILSEHQHKINTCTFVLPDNMLFSDLLKHWLEHYVDTNCEVTTKSEYERIINKHIIPYLGKIELQKLAPLHIQQYYKYLMDKKKLSANTVYRHHANIRKSLDYALKKQLVVRNVADAVDLPRKKKFEGSFYTVEQLNRLLKEVAGTEIEVPVNLAAYLGLRRGEICGLKWKHVDFDNKTVHIQEVIARINKEVITKVPKNETSIRTLHIHKDLEKLLKNHKAKQKEYKELLGRDYVASDYVCTKIDGGPFRPERLSDKFTSFLIQNKLPYIRLHDLRHTVATLLIQSKIPVKNVSEMLGHSDITTTLKIYSHVLEEAKKEAAVKMGDLLKRRK